MDDFSILAVEKCLLEPLTIIFNSSVVDTLADDIVVAIAAENESSKVEREKLTLKMKTLRNCLEQLHRLDRHNLSGAVSIPGHKLKANGLSQMSKDSPRT